MAFDILLQADAMQHRYMRRDDFVYRVGDECDGYVFVVIEGTVGAVDTFGNFKEGYEVTRGGFFGDIEVMTGNPLRLQGFRVKTISATLAMMDKRAVQLVGGIHSQFFLNLLQSAVDNLRYAEEELLKKPRT
ncbi:MAG TPA: cyclic nucleotide-binding domain-containing protein [Turneriella sp.]|nr:cyclic nucleotide-binding domain-containing protein [Turneriella sp.]